LTVSDPSDRERALLHLATFAGAYRAEVWTVAWYAVGVGLLGLTTPVAVQALVNTAAFGTLLQPLFVLVALLLLGLLLAGMLKGLKSWAVEVLQRRMFADVVARLAYLMPRMAPHSVERAEMGHPTQRFFEIFSIHKAVASLLLGAVDIVLAAAVGMVVLAFYHPLLLAFDAALIVALFGIVFGLGRHGVRTAIEESNAKYAIAGLLSELESTPYAFRHAAGRHHAKQRLDALSAQYLTARGRHYRVVLRQFLGALGTQAFASAALLALGGYLVIERELTLGQLVAAELIVATVVSTLSDLGKHLETYYDLVAGVYKLDKLLDLPAEDESGETGEEKVGEGPAAVELRDVYLSTPRGPVLEGACLRLDPGARVLLSGPAESGKTSLIELLFGLRQVDRGRLLLDGVDCRELARPALRERVAIVRGSEILSGSVIENVRLGRADVTHGKVRALLDALGMSEELARLPEGLQTKLGPGGVKISDSLGFRLTLARAIARSPGLIAIDADLTSIDSTSLRRVIEVLTRKEAPWTLLVVGDGTGPSLGFERMIRLEKGQFHEQVRS